MPRQSAEPFPDPICGLCRSKLVERQSVLALHTVRQGFVKARTAQANQIRGLLSEYGLIIPQGIWHIANRVPLAIRTAHNWGLCISVYCSRLAARASFDKFRWVRPHLPYDFFRFLQRPIVQAPVSPSASSET